MDVLEQVMGQQRAVHFGHVFRRHEVDHLVEIRHDGVLRLDAPMNHAIGWRLDIDAEFAEQLAVGSVPRFQRAGDDRVVQRADVRRRFGQGDIAAAGKTKI